MPGRTMPKSQTAPSGVTRVMWYRGLPVNRRADDDAEADRLLGVYLGDHFAGATGGLALARRIAEVHRDEAYGLPLSAFAQEVAEDREALRRMMTDLGFPLPQAKSALALVAERAGRLKPNGRFVGRSALSGVVELEAMRAGVETKAACWRTLRAVAEHDDRLSEAELHRLVDRAEDQAKRLEEMRLGMLVPTFCPSAKEVRDAEAAQAGEAVWESARGERTRQNHE
ncbi:hypothetical protein [Yinghuangia sp. YIM S09857]|uniref:hypothetical protein n=1 Tax=Yinghuangia sp. YIM S09857 TaxID=3436929 RepID=UPI003F532EA0